MIHTADPVTYQLAAMIGATAIAIGIAGARDATLWPRMIDEIERSPGLALVAGFLGVIFGALILLLPGGWSDPLAIVVSVTGLASLAKGLILIAVPVPYLRLARPLARYARAWTILIGLLGALLFLAGASGMLQ